MTWATWVFCGGNHYKPTPTTKEYEIDKGIEVQVKDACNGHIADIDIAKVGIIYVSQKSGYNGKAHVKESCAGVILYWFH